MFFLEKFFLPADFFLGALIFVCSVGTCNITSVKSSSRRFYGKRTAVICAEICIKFLISEPIALKGVTKHYISLYYTIYYKNSQGTLKAVLPKN